MSDAGIEVIETVWIPMPDGTKLAARLWLPPGARENPVPAVLEYIPYRRRDRTRMRDESIHPHFAAAGYAALRVDMRGSGDSDGVMRDEYEEDETRDGVDVIAWIAAQDWCDGNVGMFGKSWGAYNAFQVAARRPPALRAIIPVMGTDDRWLEDIHFYGGALANDNFWWGSIMQLLNTFPPDPAIVGENWRAIWRTRLEAMEFWPAMWLRHQTHDEMWRRGSISENYADVNVPVYFFGGWSDLYRDTPFRIAEHLKGPVKLLMGPWSHLYPHEGAPGPKADFLGEATRFWDHWLKGKDTGLMDEPPLRFWLQDSVAPAGSHETRPGRWVEEPGWPSANVAARTLWLNDGALAAEPGPGPARSICSPQTFGSAGGDMCSFAVPGDMPVDCRIDAAGALCFRGEALSAPLDILGQPEVELTLSADRAQGFVAALLIDEAPDGAQTLITRGFCNLMHRDGGDMAPKPATPGAEMTVRARMHGIGYRVLAGHRLMVQIASAYWPILWPAPEPVTLTLRGGVSSLKLPVRAETPGAPAPRPIEPTAIPAPPRMTQVRPGDMSRTITTDLMTGVQSQRVWIDGGVFGPIGALRLEETGTELADISDRVYAIRPDDPLSARATMAQEASFTRGDWKVRILTRSEQWATKDEFHFRARVECRDGDLLFHEVEWTDSVPRNGM